jgi:tetratricopeptide (TPR) repeat protein
MFTKKSLAVPLAFALLSACQSTPKVSAGAPEFAIYQKLTNSKKHIEAISYLQQAVNKSPENNQYASLLQQARDKAAMQLTDSISALLSSKKLDKSILDKATTLFSQAKNIIAQHDSYSTINTLITEKQANLETKVKSLYNSVKINITSNDWIKAKFTAKKLASLYPNYEDSALLGQKVKIEGSRFYLNQANVAYQNNDFRKTLEYARKSLTVDKMNKKATALIASTNEKNNKEYFLSLAQTADRTQDWSAVYKACKSALIYDANNAYCADKLVEVKAQWTEELLSQARQLMTQGHLSKSINAYKEANTINDGAKNASLASLKNSLSEKITITADELLASGHFGSAWYLFRLVADVDPVYPELFKKTKQAEDSINQRIKKSIAVFDFKSPSYNPDSGVLVANNLISNLFNSASKDINILERENLKSIIEEMKLGQIGVVSESSAQEMGRIYGIDIAIMGSVLLYKVDSTESISSETVRYKVGEEISDNIDYLNWKAVNPNAKQEDLRSAPKAKILIDKFEAKEYEVKHKKKVGFIQLSFRIVDVATGANTRVETIERKKIYEDNSNEGIKDAGIVFDPMDIPTDTELLQQMATEVVAELSRDVLQPLRNLEKKYFENGEDLILRRKESLNAIERFVDAIFDERLKSVVGSPITAQSNKYLESIVLNHRFL